jgi:Phosphotransferase enzyme family
MTCPTADRGWVMAEFNDYVRQIDKHTLTPIVRKALNQPMLEVTHWEWTDVSGSGNGYGNSAVYRITGKGKDAQQTLDWSLILKMMREQPHENPASSHYWKREYEAYQSDWLNKLPNDNFAAPRCYHAAWSRGEPAYIWLEDIRAAEECRSQERLVICARHLGQFNGIYMGTTSRPSYPWLSTDWIRQDFALATRSLAVLDAVDSNRHLQRLWHPKRKENVRRLYAERETFFAALDQLPKTVLHLDSFSRNLFMRQVDGHAQTVAIDWAFTGIETLGAELVSLVFVSLLFLDVPARAAAEFEQQAFAAYLAGLREVGWTGDEAQVRLGLTAAIGMRHVGTIMGLRSLLVNEEAVKGIEATFNLSMEETLDRLNVVGEFIDGLTDEARALINKQQ